MAQSYEHLSRQLDLIPVELLTKPITIIGAGAIGSFACLQLAKMGCSNIMVWDHDEVSIENMNSQFYRHKDIGRPKVEALADLVFDFTGVKISFVASRWTPGPTTTNIVLLCVDTMAARKDIFRQLQNSCFAVNYVIDSRMGAEDALLYTVNLESKADADMYEITLYSDANAVQQRCTAKSTIYTANLLSGMVVKTVKNLLCNQSYPRVSMWAIGGNELTQSEGRI